MKPIGILLSLFFSLFLITSVYAQTERDFESEYCSNNWIIDKTRCVEYIPEEKKVGFSARHHGFVVDKDYTYFIKWTIYRPI